VERTGSDVEKTLISLVSQANLQHSIKRKNHPKSKKKIIKIIKIMKIPQDGCSIPIDRRLQVTEEEEWEGFEEVPATHRAELVFVPDHDKTDPIPPAQAQELVS
jgi:hypothetical protein